MTAMRASLRVLGTVAVCLALLVGGCRSKKSQPAESNEPSAAPSVSGQPSSVDESAPSKATEPGKTAGDKSAPVVTVNGTTITEAQVSAQLDPLLERMKDRAAQLPPQFLEQYKRQVRARVIDQLVIEKLLDDQIAKANITISDEQVLAELKKAVSPDQPITDQELRNRIEQLGRNFDQLKEQVRKDLARQKLLERQWAGRLNVSEQQAKQYYEQNKQRFNRPEQVRASHILIEVSPNDPQEKKDQALAKAKQLLEQIQGGADFAELARAHSACPSSSRGGDLGYFGKGEMEEPFEKAVFALQVGQVGDIVQTRYGYHIIKVTDRRPARQIPFKEARDSIIAQLKEAKKAEIAREYINSLKAAAKIVYSPGNEPPSMPPVPGAMAP